MSVRRLPASVVEWMFLGVGAQFRILLNRFFHFVIGQILFVAKRLGLNVCSGERRVRKKRRRGTGRTSRHLTVSVLADGDPIRLGYRFPYPGPYLYPYLYLCLYPYHRHRPLCSWPAPGSLVHRSRECSCPSW